MEGKNPQAEAASAGSDSEAQRLDRQLDIELDQTFPASDPIPWIHEPDRLAEGRPESAGRGGRLYFEDFADGQRYTTGSIAVSEDEIRAFASRFDPQPFHMDVEAARRSLFGGLVASGWHTAAMSMRLLVESGPQIAGGLIGLGGEMRWPRATRPGDVLHVECRVIETRPSSSMPGHGIVTVRNETLNQHGEVVQTGIASLLVPRKP